MDLQAIFDIVAKRTDDWLDDGAKYNVNSSLDIDFKTRHPVLSYTYLAILGVLTVIGNLANIMVICAVITYRPLRTTGNMFIVNLALADLCMTAVGDPFSIVGVIAGPKFFLDNALLCHIVAALCVTSCTVSMWTIAAVALNRYVFICKHHIYGKYYTWKKTVAYCFLLWVIGVGIDVPNVTGWGSHTFDLKTMACSHDRIADMSYTYFLTLYSILLPLLIMFISYCLVFKYVRSVRKKLQSRDTRINSRYRSRQRAEYNLAKTLSITCIVYIIFWAPYTIVINADGGDNWSKIIYVVVIMLAHASSSVNSVMYAVVNERFRSGYRHLLLGMLKCRMPQPKRNTSVFSLSRNSTDLNWEHEM
ncbi:hypothetical protein ScPMuIL_018947 [Solemya velum]